MAYNKNFKQANNNAPKAADKFKNWEYGKIKVTVSPGKKSLKDNEPSSMVNLYNIEPDDAQEIVQRLTTNPGKKTANAWVDKTEPTHLTIKVYVKDFDAWLDGGDLNSIQAVLYKSGKYDNNEIAHLEDQIGSSFGSADTEQNKQLMTNADESAMDMWNRYLNTINDKDTMDALLKYKRMYNDQGLDSVLGIVLSVKNVDLIRSVNPDATFVTTKGNWEKMFGRGVIRNAKKCPYWVWIPSNSSDTAFKAAQDNSIWKGQERSELPPQVERELEKLAQAENNNGFLKISIGYDVADTYLLDGAKEDKFNTTVGRANNLTGELNQAAKDLVAKNAADAATQQQQQPTGQTEDEKRTEMAADYMRTNADTLGITAKNSGDANRDLADMVYDYCLKKATTKAGILQSTNSSTYANNATRISLILTRLATPEISRFNATHTYPRKEVASLMSVVYGTVMMLEGHSKLNEGVMSWLKDKASFIKQFMKAFRSIGCKVVDENPEVKKQEIMESFQNIYNRINADLF